MQDRRRPTSQPVALVTGAARGIGAATAHRLETSGYLVVRADINWNESAALGEFLDVSLSESWSDLLARLSSRHQHIDVLVNNAGLSGRNTLLSTPADEWSKIVNTTLTGTWLGIQHCVPLMTPGSSIVNLGSVYGSRLPPTSTDAPVSPAYQVSKAAIHHLTKVAAQEVGARGIRVNAVAPGFIETDFVNSIPEVDAARRRSGAFLKRSGTVDEVAETIAFLTSPQASFITGEVLEVSGGYGDEYTPSFNAV